MLRQMILFSLAGLLLAPIPLLAQRPGGTGGPGSGPAIQMLQRNPIEAIVDARAELGLTEEQVARLEPVRARLLEQNRENLARIDSLLQSTPRAASGNREAMQAVMERVRPLRQKVQENNQAALQEIRPHLSTAQWEKVTEMLRPRRQPGG